MRTDNRYSNEIEINYYGLMPGGIVCIVIAVLISVITFCFQSMTNNLGERVDFIFFSPSSIATYQLSKA